MGKICFFTGHRELPPDKIEEIARLLERALRKLIESGYTEFRAGGALGFDTLAAQTVLSLRSEFSRIRLVLILPCKEQAKRWSERDQRLYEAIKQSADEVIYTAEHYFRGCMQKRNRRLADGSDICVCYLTKYTGGTAYTVNYAVKQGKPICNVADRVTPAGA